MRFFRVRAAHLQMELLTVCRWDECSVKNTRKYWQIFFQEEPSKNNFS